MPLDHYIPQVYLKKWYSSILDNLMYATRKSDLKSFTPDSQSVCRIKDGSTNKYLKDERVIEKFLRTIEPQYNKVIEKVSLKNMDHECVYTISGLIAYVLTCSPMAIRLNTNPIEKIVETAAIIADKAGKIPKPPEILGANSLSELISNKSLHITVDEKYSQAMGIASIFNMIKCYGNFTWEILLNPYTTSPFFTSDFPIAYEAANDPSLLNIHFPLTPYLLIKIYPNRNIDKDKARLTFPLFQYNYREASKRETIRLNELIIKSAEDIVFYKEKYNWTENYIKKHSKYCITSQVSKVGPYLTGIRKIVKNLE